MKKYMTLKMSDGSIWGFPTDIIARNRAEHYAKEFDGDVEWSLEEDTLPLFEGDSYTIEDWARCNMNPEDFKGFIVKLKDPPLIDFNDEWLNAKIGFSD